jgi:hypothetical protein
MSITPDFVDIVLPESIRVKLRAFSVHMCPAFKSYNETFTKILLAIALTLDKVDIDALPATYYHREIAIKKANRHIEVILCKPHIDYSCYQIKLGFGTNVVDFYVLASDWRGPKVVIDKTIDKLIGLAVCSENNGLSS